MRFRRSPLRLIAMPRIAALAAALLLALPAVARAQRIDTAFKGSVLDKLTTRGDSNFHYAAYIPRGYEPEHPAPLLLMLDPQGRGDQAIRLVVPAAERLGWLVMSSYDTRSDVANAPNEKAVNLMLADALRTFHIDTSRLYIAGFSGTARDAWAFGYGSSGHVAGIISAGAAMPGDTSWRRRFGGQPPYDVALAAGEHDFNYDEVVNTADTLRGLDAGVRADGFAGGHQWPPAAVLGQEMGWLEARAMARHLAPFDTTLADSLFGVDSAWAVAAATSKRPGLASLRWDNILHAWRGIHDLASARRADSLLTADPAVRAWRAEFDSLVKLTAPARRAIGATLTALRKHPGVPDLRRLIDSLNIVHYQQWTADTTDSLRATWADRRLSDLYVQVSFYEPEAYMHVGDAGRALSMLAVAEIIHPRSPGICRERARAYALQRDIDATINELRCALNGKEITLAEIRADPRYMFMRSNEDFQALLEGKQ